MEKLTKSQVRERVILAFKEVRKQGIIARANFMCCQTCAGYDLATMAEKRQSNGWVFWHRQDEEHFWRSGVLFLAYTGADECDKPPTNPMTTKQVGLVLKQALLNQGLNIEWNGETNERIKVIWKA